MVKTSQKHDPVAISIVARLTPYMGTHCVEKPTGRNVCERNLVKLNRSREPKDCPTKVGIGWDGANLITSNRW